MGSMPEPTQWHPPLPRSYRREDLTDKARCLWDLWQQGQRPKVDDFVREAGAEDLDEILAVLRVDQSQRFRLGETVLTETYLRAFPSLANDSERALDLIFAEYVLREETGAKPTLQEFLDRFPQYARELSLQVEAHQATGTQHAPAGRELGETICRWVDLR
jgi:hypothetical protein